MTRVHLTLLFLITLSAAATLRAAATLGAAASEELLDAGHFLRAKAMLDPLVQANPDDAQAAYFLSRAEGALGNLEVSLKLADRAVSLADSNANYHVQVAAACGRLAQASNLMKQLGYAKRAKKELDLSLELDANNVDALYGLALFYYAAPSFVGGDKTKAQECADALTRLDPTRGYMTQAKLAKERKDAAAEEQFYKLAITAKPDFYDSHGALATLYALHGNIAAAKQEAIEALAIDPERAEAWKVLAQVHVATQCWDELLELLETAHAAVPDDLAYYYSAALALEESGHYLPWAMDFVAVYLNTPPEGNEPVLAEVAKTVKRLKAAML